MKINFIISILTLTLLFACDPNGKETTTDKDQIDSTKEETIKKISAQKELKTEPQQNEQIGEQAHHFICFKGDTNAALEISISYDENDKALKVKYKGQDESMALSFLNEDYIEGGAQPAIEIFYSEIYKGKENGVYKLSHSGVWDYAEYTRSKDGKKFNFTIDHELTIENDGYRTTPCF